MDDVKAIKTYLEELLDRELATPMSASLALLSCPTGTCVVCKQLPCTSINSRTTKAGKDYDCAICSGCGHSGSVYTLCQQNCHAPVYEKVLHAARLNIGNGGNPADSGNKQQPAAPASAPISVSISISGPASPFVGQSRTQGHPADEARCHACMHPQPAHAASAPAATAAQPTQRTQHGTVATPHVEKRQALVAVQPARARGRRAARSPPAARRAPAPSASAAHLQQRRPY
jgi:hypothetical protein